VGRGAESEGRDDAGGAGGGKRVVPVDWGVNVRMSVHSLKVWVLESAPSLMVRVTVTPSVCPSQEDHSSR